MLARLANIHRHHRAQALLRQRLATGLKQCPEAAGGDGEYDVVDGPSERGLDRFQVSQRDARDLEAPSGADRLVQARVRGAAQLLADDQLDRGARLSKSLTRVDQPVR